MEHMHGRIKKMGNNDLKKVDFDKREFEIAVCNSNVKIEQKNNDDIDHNFYRNLVIQISGEKLWLC